MNFLYRPTPILNPGPPADVVLSRLPAGMMRGYDGSVNWKAYFDSQRAAVQGNPWIVRSGTMGSFVLGQDDGSIDYSNLPFPTDIGGSLSPLTPALPVDLYPMSPPIDPSIAPYSPGAPPSIVSSGGPILPPSSSGFNITQFINSLTSLGTNIARAATGQITPSIAPVPPSAAAGSQLTQPSALVASAQTLQAQANALDASNPALAAQYRQRAAALLAQAGSGASWFSQSTIISGVPDVAVYGGGALALLLIVGAMRGKK